MDYYLLYRINKLKDSVQSAKILSNIDFKYSYNFLRHREGNEWKTVFRSCYSHFENLAMPIGLANAPASFQAVINNIFWDLSGNRVLIYVDNIFIYSKTEKQHHKLIKKVFQYIFKYSLAAAIQKCNFYIDKIEYLV